MWTKRDEKLARENALSAALSSGGAGSLYGAGFSLLGGADKASKIAKIAAKSGLLSASLGGGGVYLGSKLLGNPEDEETTGFTRRATLGSGLVGSALGGLAGGLGGAGVIPKSLQGGEGILSRGLTKLASKSSPSRVLAGLGIGALAGGLGGSMIGSDEGMVIDFINQEKKRRLLNREEGEYG